MAWICLVASGDCPSPLKSGSKQSLTVRTIATLKVFSYHEWLKERLKRLLFVPMSEKSKKIISKILLKSYSEDFRARTSVLQEMERAWQESEAVFSSKLLDWSKKSSPHSYSWKTCQPLGLEDFLRSSMNLQKWGMTVGGRVSLPQALEPRTSEKDGFYWPTPVANDDNKSPQAHMAMKARMKGGARKKCTSLNVMVKGVEMRIFPTPTPTARSPQDCPSERKRKDPSLEAQANISLNQIGGQLNPTWVEWLMGFPLEWSVLNALGMQWFHSKPKKPSKNSST